MKLVAFDMDGTLLNHSGDVSEETSRVLDLLTEKGIVLALCTGRAYESAQNIIKKIRLEEKGGYFCGMNGQTIVSYRTHQHINKAGLTASQIKKLVMYTENKNVLSIVQKGNNMTAVYNRKKKWIVRLYQIVNHMFWIYRQNDNYEIRTVLREELMPEGDEKVCFTGLPWTLRKIAEKIEADYKEEYRCTFVSPFWMECQLSDITKGEALRIIAKLEGIDVSETMAFGDGENDISMLQAAGLGVAVKNAMKKTRQIADDLCKENTKDGVAEYLKDYFSLT